MTDAPTRDDSTATQIRVGLPERTTPTWEVELLISGVAVFAMLQLPGWLDDRYFELFPRLNLEWVFTLFYGYVYAKCGALILAATFVLHLLLRAHWIALVGVDSIYPGGVLWDRVRMGPVQREVARGDLGTIADAIERADNRATLVFATGVYLALQMIKMFLLVIVCAAVGWIASFFVQVDARLFLIYGIAIVVLPLLLLWRLDHAIGARLASDGIAARALRFLFRGFATIGFGRGSAPGMLLMSSNAGSRRVYASVFAITLGAIAVIIVGVEFARDPDRTGNYAFVPVEARDSAATLLRQHYDDQRGDQRPGWIPFVQSQVIVDPYLRLTIPIRPALHEPAMRRHCPQAEASKNPNRARLDCLAAMHPLKLDGRPLQMEYDLASDPRAKLPALVAMIDVRDLANGRHELRVGQPENADGQPGKPDVIAFWR